MMNVLQEKARVRRSQVVWWLLLALIAGSAGLASIPASATHSTAAPTIDAYGIAPNMGPKEGGTPFRIHGTGFHALGGVTVVFDKLGFTANATKVRVVDDNLITGLSPASPSWEPAGTHPGETTIKVVTVNGTAENHIFNGGTGWFYWDTTSTQTGSAEPKLTLTSPATELANGSAVNVSVSGYPADSTIQIAQASPLATFLEPRRWSGANPDIKILAQPTTDANGAWSGTVNVIQGNLGATDPAAQCPTTEAQANVGARRCWLTAVHYGRYIARQQISFSTNEPTGAAATLVHSPTDSSFSVGQSISLSGVNWRGSPVLGSSNDLTDLVGTQLTVQICGINGSAGSCSATSGSGSVAVTRYVSTYGGTLNPGSTAGLSGATLSGSITVGADLSGACGSTAAPTCFVKVVQSPDTTFPGTQQVSAQSTNFSVA